MDNFIFVLIQKGKVSLESSAIAHNAPLQLRHLTVLLKTVLVFSKVSCDACFGYMDI